MSDPGTSPTLAPGDPYNPTPAPAPVAVALPDQNQSAKAIIDDALARWGLSGLSPVAWGLIQSGASNPEVIAKIRQTPEYAQRFAGNIERQQAGLTPLSEADYLDRETQIANQMELGGLPRGFYDQPADFVHLIGRGVSVESLANRIEQGYVRVANASPYTRQVFAQQFGPSSDSALAAFFIDPDRALPTLERMATEAEIGGNAVRFGIGSDFSTAQRLAGLGVTGSQAAQGFAQIAAMSQVFAPTITEDNSVTAAGTGVKAILEQDAAATDAIRRRQGTRQAAFDQTGGALATNAGVLGLGTLAS